MFELLVPLNFKDFVKSVGVFLSVWRKDHIPDYIACHASHFPQDDASHRDVHSKLIVANIRCTLYYKYILYIIFQFVGMFFECLEKIWHFRLLYLPCQSVTSSRTTPDTGMFPAN